MIFMNTLFVTNTSIFQLKSEDIFVDSYLSESKITRLLDKNEVCHSTRQKWMFIDLISYFIKFYYLLLIAASLFSINILHCSNISFFRVLISFMMILSYLFNMICFSSANVLSCRLLTRCLRICHTVLDEFQIERLWRMRQRFNLLATLKRTTTLSFDRMSWLLSLFFL
jgi:hypothetical protein